MENISTNEVMTFFHDTSKLTAKEKANQLQVMADAYTNSNALTNRVEFWNWMDRNFNGAGGNMFSSNQAMKDYLAQGQGKVDWVQKQLQGKGYEWDWMQQQRSSITNIFKKYEAGDVSNQPAIDVTERNILSGREKEYQMKAYISQNNPKLHNTDKSVTVITNAEKVENVSAKGYTVEPYKNKDEIIQDVNNRMKDINDGTATPQYNIKNVGGAMLKSGIIACVFSAGIETIASYRKWKSGEISDKEYLSEIGKASGDAGITAAATTGIMIPVSSVVVSAGVSSIVTIPVAFVVSSSINKLVAPCFGRGEYKKILNHAHYYLELESMYSNFISSVENSVCEYEYFISKLCAQNSRYKQIKEKDKAVTESLKNIYDSI